MILSRMVMFVLLLTVVYPVTSIDMYVEIEDDHGHREKYNISEELEEMLKEEPPYEVPSEDMEKEYKNKFRPKRALNLLDEMPFTRKLPKCKNFIRNYRKQTQGAPIQLLYSVQMGDDIRMTCHYCGDKETYGKTIEWKIAHRKKIANFYFRITPVKLDMHDDESKNRVFIDEDFNLHIKKSSIRDRGTYFCHDMTTHDAHVVTRLNVYQLRDFFYSRTRFRVYYNVEVVLPSKIPVRRVDRTGKRFPKPLKTQAKYGNYDIGQTDNLIYYTNWGDWTACSVCGQQGERKRLGICTARIWNLQYMTLHFEHIYYVLKAYQPGVPCRSSLFHGFKRMLRRNRPDEVEYKKCHVRCSKGLFGGKKFGKVEIKKINFIGIKKKVPEKTVTIMEGNRVDLVCPGSNIDTLVYWINGTKYLSSIKLRDKTKKRMDIDAYNVFVIHTALVIDSGILTCWYGGKRQLIFNLKVTRKPGLAGWIQHLIYLCYSFTVDFWMFLIILIVRHKHRLVIRTNLKPKKSLKKPDEESDKESVDSDEEESEDVDDDSEEELVDPDEDELENSDKEELVDPKKELVDPKKKLVDPKKELLDPKKELIDLKKELFDPKKKLENPKKELIDLKKELVDPKKELIDLKKELVDPKKKLVDPMKGLVDLEKELVDPDVKVLIPKKEVEDPSEKVAAPRRKSRKKLFDV